MLPASTRNRLHKERARERLSGWERHRRRGKDLSGLQDEGLNCLNEYCSSASVLVEHPDKQKKQNRPKGVSMRNALVMSTLHSRIMIKGCKLRDYSSYFPLTCST